MSAIFNLSPEIKNIITEFSQLADEETLAPFAAKIGVSTKALLGILKALPLFLDEDFNLKKLLPSLLPVLTSSLFEKKEKNISSPLETLSAGSENPYEIKEAKSNEEWNLFLQSDDGF